MIHERLFPSLLGSLCKAKVVECKLTLEAVLLLTCSSLPQHLTKKQESRV